MKTKNFSLMFAGILTIVFLTSLISATITISNIPELSKTGNSFKLTAETDETEDLTFELNDITYQGETITFSTLTESFNNESKQVTINYNVPSNFEFELGEDYSTTLTVTGSVSTSPATQTISFEDTDYCRFGEQGNWFTIKVNDLRHDNRDRWKWRPNDEIHISVEINNRHRDDVEGYIEYGLYDTRNNEFIFEEELDFDVYDGEKEEFIIEFKIDPRDLNDNTGNNDYVFYIKVYDDYDASEETQCKQFSRNVEIKRNRAEIILDLKTIQIPTDASCGSTAQLMLDFINIGTREQKDVSVRIYNSELGLDLKKDLGDVDVGRSKKVLFELEIPKDADEKTYSLQVEIFDEDNDVYEIEDHDGDDQDARYFFAFELAQGSCRINPGDFTEITAEIQSGGKAGRELVIKSTIINSGDELRTYNLEATDYSDWATLDSIEPNSATLGPGQSQEVLYTFTVNDDVEGEQIFNIQASVEDEGITQPVSVTIEKSGFNFPGITGNVISSDNWYLWGIGILNVILVIIIIIVAIRVARS